MIQGTEGAHLHGCSCRRIVCPTWFGLGAALLIAGPVLAQPVARLRPTTPDYQDYFADAVALAEADDGAWALVGAPGDNDATGDAGSVFAYWRDGAGVWHLQAQLFAPGAPLYQGGFGSGVALAQEGEMAGRLLLVAETGYDAPGQAYVFRREGEGMESVWSVEAVLVPDSLRHPDHVFGYGLPAVALDASPEAEAQSGIVAVVGR